MRVFILLDRSGSMASRWVEAISSINTYAKELTDKDATIKLTAFDLYGDSSGSQLKYEVVTECTAGEWVNVSPSQINPRGSTPLYDAVGRMISEAQEANDERTVFVIMTDGYENASREFTRGQIESLIKSASENKKWPTIFLGADFSAVNQVAADIGVSAHNTVNMTAGNMMRGMQKAAAKTTAYFSSGDVASMAWSWEEQEDLSSKKPAKTPGVNVTSTISAEDLQKFFDNTPSAS